MRALALVAVVAFGPGCRLGFIDYVYVDGTVSIHNATDEVMEVQVELPDGELALCGYLATHPEVYGSIPWRLARTETLAPRINRAIYDFDNADCGLMRVSSPSLGSAIVFWNEDTVASRQNPGSYDSLQEVDEGVVILDPSARRPIEGSSPDLVFDDPGPLPTCADAERMRWHTTHQRGTVVRVGALECPVVELDTLSGPGLLELCVPPDTVPFAPGQELDISPGQFELEVYGGASAPDLFAGVGVSSMLDLGLYPTRFDPAVCLREEANCLFVEPSVMDVWHDSESVGTIAIRESSTVTLQDGDDLSIHVSRRSEPVFSNCTGLTDFVVSR